MREYLQSAGSVSPTIMGASRAYDVVAAMVPTAAKPGAMVTTNKPSLMSSVGKFIPSAVGLAAGYLAAPYAGPLKRHRILSALAGHAVVNSGYALYKGGDKKRALCELAVEGAGILGALKYKRSPILGWLGGIAVGTVATYFVEGSPARDELAWLKGKF